MKKEGLTVQKEVVIDKESRIDLTIEEIKIGIEVKLTKDLSRHYDPYKQRARYAESLGEEWDVYLVSLDGSIGLSYQSLIELIINL